MLIPGVKTPNNCPSSYSYFCILQVRDTNKNTVESECVLLLLLLSLIDFGIKFQSPYHTNLADKIKSCENLGM